MEKNMELEEAREILKSYENKLVYEISEKDKEAVAVVLNHITKQEKMIELMAIKIKKQINCYDPCWLEYEDDNIKCYGQKKCKECIKQYFEKKVNKEVE